MARRRGNGEGSVFQRKDGRWCATFVGADGRRRSFYAATMREARQSRDAARRDHERGLTDASRRETVATLAARWLEVQRTNVRPHTWARYEQYLRLHVLPAIGQVPVAKLGPQHLEQLYARCLDRGLSPMSVKHLHTVMHSLLRRAERWNLVARNVATLVDAPRAERAELRTLDAGESARLLEAAAGHPLEAFITLAITTGMRSGEMLGLRWRDVHLDAGMLRVTGALQRSGASWTIAEPKTERSRRQVALGPLAVEALRVHRATVAQRRLAAGSEWQENGLVFPGPLGLPQHEQVVLRQFRTLLRKSGLPPLRIHDLRHTAASLMLAENVHAKIVSDMLGHASITVTLDTYSHVMPALHRDAAGTIDRLLARQVAADSETSAT